MQNRRYSKRITHENLSWLNIEAYEETKDWSLVQWTTNLRYRHCMKLLLKWRREEDAEYLTERIAWLMASPAITTGKDHDFLFFSGEPMVFDMEVLDFYNGVEKLEAAAFKDVVEARASWRNAIDESGNRSLTPPDLLRKGFMDLIHERTPRYRSHEALHVNLSATDTQLIEDFKSWLVEKRKTRPKGTPRKDVTNADLCDWYRFRVLAFIDIDLFCTFLRSRASNTIIGNALFPQEFEVDLTERVRKVIRPLANRLMTANFMSAIDAQAARSEPKIMDSIPE